MSSHRSIATLVMVVGITLAPALAFAQPGLTSLVSVQESGSYTFTFTRVDGATWYYLWANEGATPKFQKWFTAAELRCAGTEANCFIAIPLPRAAFGTHAWWVQTYGPTLYGPWSAQGSWTSRPPMPPIVTDSTGQYLGSLMSDNYVLMDVAGLPARAVILPTGFMTISVSLFYTQVSCGGQAYANAVIPDRIEFPFTVGVSQGYLIRGAPITATSVSTRQTNANGTFGTCDADGNSRTMMPVTQVDLTSQFGSLTMPLKVVR
jgi:hypothetical protein